MTLLEKIAPFEYAQHQKNIPASLPIRAADPAITLLAKPPSRKKRVRIIALFAIAVIVSLIIG